MRGAVEKRDDLFPRLEPREGGDAMSRERFRFRHLGAACVPANWSARDWREEMRAERAAAAWQARCDYDPGRGVPLEFFVHQRVMARLLARHRKEWAYTSRCEGEGVGVEGLEDERRLPVADHDDLRRSLGRLSEADRWTIERLFWDAWTETEVAGALGISQQAVNKRKRNILVSLYHSIRET
jgi:DNA-directed RNA polymerase specialized sigma24 family protein